MISSLKNHWEIWKETWTSDRLVAASTVAMAVFTLFLAILAALQWHEIHAGSADTHELAIAAQTQAANTATLANAAKKQAEEAALQVEKLQSQIDRQDKMLGEATMQAKATNQLAAEEKRGADSAKEEVEIARSAQRPWMVFQITADEPSPGSKFKITATAQNSGKSPAYVLASQLSWIYTSQPPEDFTAIPQMGLKNSLLSGSQTVVTPGAAYTSQYDAEDNLSEPHNELVQIGFEKWYIYAYLTYQDIDTSKIYRS